MAVPRAARVAVVLAAVALFLRSIASFEAGSEANTGLNFVLRDGASSETTATPAPTRTRTQEAPAQDMPTQETLTQDVSTQDVPILPTRNVPTMTPTITKPRDGRIRLPDLVRVREGVSVYVFDAIFVPRHSYIAMTSLLHEGIVFGKGEIVADWDYPGVNSTTLVRPCKAFKSPVVELEDGEFVPLGECVRIVPLGGNIGRDDRASFCTFQVPAEGLQRILRFAQTAGPAASLRLHLTETAHVTIGLSSRSAGLLRNCTRPPADLGDAQAFDNPFGNSVSRDKATIAICLKQLVSPTPYIHEIVLYYKRLGVSHVYLGVKGDDLVQYLHDRVGWFIASGFLTLVRMDDTPGVRIHMGKPVFLFSCLHHAKQLDTFVAAWDVDEVPIITDKRVRGTEPHLGMYLFDEILGGNVTVGPLDRSEVWNLPKRNNAHPVPYFCEWTLQGLVAMPSKPGEALAVEDRVGRLNEDFPLRTTEAMYFHAPHYMKSVAVAATMYMLEIHKHSNCRLTDETGLHFSSNDIAQRIPQERRLYPDGLKVAVMHFANMHLNRYRTSRRTARSEFADIMKGYRRVVELGTDQAPAIAESRGAA